VQGFPDLATLLDTEMPLFAIEAQRVDSVSDPDQDMHAMVQHYIDRIKTVQTDGPYFLMGHSFGGAVVFEMAPDRGDAGTRGMPYPPGARR
jgi:thioesterase domain-containing protein